MWFLTVLKFRQCLAVTFVLLYTRENPGYELILRYLVHFAPAFYNEMYVFVEM